LPAAGTWTVTESVGSPQYQVPELLQLQRITANTYTFTVKNAAVVLRDLSTNGLINPQPSPPMAPIASTTIQPSCSSATGTIVVTAPLVLINIISMVVLSSLLLYSPEY